MYQLQIDDSKGLDDVLQYTVRKIVMNSLKSYQIKRVVNGVTTIIDYDFSNAKEGISYRDNDNRESLSLNDVFYFFIGETQYAGNSIQIQFGGGNNVFSAIPSNGNLSAPTTFPAVIYHDSTNGETDATDDLVPQTFIKFPPDETDVQWAARIEPRITRMARCYADGLPQQYARLSALSEKVHSSGIGEGHARGNRYDSAANAGQFMIGFIRWQFYKLVNGVTEDLFRTRETLEEDIEKVEAVMRDEDWVKDFYLKHNHTRWSAHSKRGRVHIPTDDYDLGEKIHDTFRLTPGQLPHDEEEEAKSEAELLTLVECFGDAIHSLKSEMVTELEVEPLEYLPDERNSALRELTVAVDTGSLDLTAPVNIGGPDGFAPDRLEYNVIIPSGKNTVGIVASPEHSGASVTGTGDVTITDRNAVKVVNVVVTSEDGHATTTYIINMYALT